jgi:hypothetical protein
MPQKIIPSMPKLVYIHLYGSGGMLKGFTEDTPARPDGGAVGYVKDFPIGTSVEVFVDGKWQEGLIESTPSELIFHVSVISNETEREVGRILHQRLFADHETGRLPIPWVKLIPPSKQVK